MSSQPLPPLRPIPTPASRAAPKPPRRQGPYVWLFIGTAICALVLGGLWVWSEARAAQERAQLEEELDYMRYELSDYEDAVDECRESALAWISLAQAQNDTISAYMDGLQTFFSPWNYRAGDISVIYEGVDRVAPAREAAYDTATASACEHP